MIGDKLIISDYHLAAAQLILQHIRLLRLNKPFSITVAGESGSGKSEIAEVLRTKLSEEGYRVLVLGQDDYFRLPPHSNHKQRKIDINWVGPMEVQLQLLDEHIETLCSSERRKVVKPLVHFAEDRIGTETITGPYDVVIAEGTYVSLLSKIDVRIFLDADFRQTRTHRLARKRDQALEDGQDQELSFLEKVLLIEHEIISRHKNLAQVIVPGPEKLLKKNDAAATQKFD